MESKCNSRREITTTSYVCDGQNGVDGQDGLDGYTTLVASTSEPPGNYCNVGGTRIDSGIDWNQNAILEVSEITTTSYVCDGQNGVDGQDGLDGYTTLVASTSEPPGNYCNVGGTRIDSGIDWNQNAILEPSEITTTSYVCDGQNGVDGQDGLDGYTTLVASTSEPPGN